MQHKCHDGHAYTCSVCSIAACDCDSTCNRMETTSKEHVQGNVDDDWLTHTCDSVMRQLECCRHIKCTRFFITVIGQTTKLQTRKLLAMHYFLTKST